MSNAENSAALYFAAFLALLVALPASLAQSGEKKQGFFAKHFNKKEEKSVTLEDWRQPETLSHQLKDIQNRIEKLEKDLESTDDEDDEDDIKDTLEILEFIEKWGSETLETKPSEKNILSANIQISRILRGIDDPVKGDKLPGIDKLFSNIFLGDSIGHEIPNLSASRQNRALGPLRAGKESTFLYDPGDRSFYTVEELAGKTPEQVSQLDISPEHPAWHRSDEFARIRNGRLKNFEAWLEEGITAVLRDDDDLKKGETWDLHSSRRVVFLKDIYFSATSPKGKVEDAYGVDWKLKWADETQVEPICSRLYLLAGGKMTDGNFVNGYGPDAMTLILAKPGEYKEKKDDEGEMKEPKQGDEREPETVEQLKKTLLDFYGFDVDPYIHSHGNITAHNVDYILRNLPGNGKEKFSKEKLIGRQWIAFKESMMELKPKGFIERFESSRMSDLAAMNDRVIRGAYLFNLWIGNRDVKDDNNKAFFVREPSGKKNKLKIAHYHEGQHDMGLSLGGLWQSGTVNDINTGRDFARKGLFGRTIRFPIALIFTPDSWEDTTWSDAKWMARKITSISEGEIQEAVASSKWPDFMQDVFVYKILDRRNRVGEMFDLTDQLDHYPVEAPNLTVALGTAAEIRAAEQKYGLPENSLKKELAALGIGAGYSEAILSNGVLISCTDSALTRLIVRHRHPSGLDQRYDRTWDEHPACIEEWQKEEE